LIEENRFGEGWGWKTLVPCLSKYTEKSGMLLFGPTPHPH
jgi:hypothetical protein